MIRGVHTMFYSSEPEALRTFLRDKIGLSATDVGGGWLIFDLPEADMGCHPTEGTKDAQDRPIPSGTPYLSFYCDDLEKTIVELQARGVEFTGGISDAGYGLATRMKAPGDFEIELYQPNYR